MAISLAEPGPNRVAGQFSVTLVRVRDPQLVVSCHPIPPTPHERFRVFMEVVGQHRGHAQDRIQVGS